jgi:hypothetical protein
LGRVLNCLLSCTLSSLAGRIDERLHVSSRGSTDSPRATPATYGRAMTKTTEAFTSYDSADYLTDVEDVAAYLQS